MLGRCVIITAWAPDGIRDVVGLAPDDFIICADGGYALAQRENILPNSVVGDFDSLGKMPEDLPEGCQIIQAAREKNETDTFLCLSHGMQAGFRTFAVAGGIGGRLDHTVANLQLLAYAARRGLNMWMMDANNRVTAIGPGEKRIAKIPGWKLSILAHDKACYGVTLQNVKYPLKDAVLTNEFPLGISNEFEGPEAIITLKEGLLLLFVSRDAAISADDQARGGAGKR